MQLYIGTSLDGYIADERGGVGWLEQFLVDGTDYGYPAFLDQTAAVVIGATSYEQERQRGSWPYGERPTWVLTHRQLDRPRQADVRFTRRSAPELAAEIRQVTQGNVFVVGGANVASQFMASGALDELWLFIAPVLLGQGLHLFGHTGTARAQLEELQTFPTGMVKLRYRFPGPHSRAGERDALAAPAEDAQRGVTVVRRAPAVRA